MGESPYSSHVNLACCVSCHRALDLPSQHLRALDREIAAVSGYRLLGARVVYYGLCPECQKRNGR
ncbi:MAG: hypothetical protein IT330_16250 [Anaerolineae bacterium]|nr:hypothetical protein [Anaerolineae bacterium]